MASNRYDESKPAQYGNPRAGSSLTLWSAALLILSFTVAAWYLIGDLSTVPPSQADYMSPPIPISAGGEHTLGIASIILSCSGVALLYALSKRGLTTRRTWITLAPLLVAGLIIAAIERVITAAVIGANIGGGIAILLGAPIAAVLIIGALVYWIVSYSRERRHRR